MLACRSVFAPADYAFDLPAELIAQAPPEIRDGTRLLHVEASGALADLAFPALVELLPRDAIVVVNDTRVIPARVLGNKPTGGIVELLFLEPEPAIEVVEPPGASAWRCLARARRALKKGQVIIVGDVRLVVLAERASDGSIAIGVPGDTLAFLDAAGHVPLPRYITRPDGVNPSDRERYQTVFARVPGAVAAPTAGLHLTDALLDQLRARGNTIASVTLHVGYGTFEPIRTDDIREHHMHRERYVIPEATAELVATGRPVVAIGTTALRALEAAATGPHTLTAGEGATELFVYPGSGHQLRIVDHLVTNFHLPESTLLMLVSAFAGSEAIRAAYAHAIAARYRFFSYGDAMLLHRS